MSDSGPPPRGGEGHNLNTDDKLEGNQELQQAGAEVETSDSVVDSATSTTGAWASGGKKKCQGRTYVDIIN